jgi:NADPH:quinone reductase-like Zn-dependent oxidoreductase
VRSSSVWPDGTRVWFATDAGMKPGDGSMAELCSVPDDDLVPLPQGVDAAQAAALGLSAVAAWMSLTARAALRPGERVLVLGGGGVVGQVAVRAARLLGASRVVAAARSDGARDRSRAAGADEVVALAADDDVADLAARFEAALGGHADVVVDPLCGLPASAAGLVLGEGGRLVNLGSSAGPTATFDSAALRSRSAAILGYTNNALTKAERRDALTSVLTHAAEGELQVAYTVLPLPEIRRAWQAQRDGVGRVVLRP